jgi:hypothetical protein
MRLYCFKCTCHVDTRELLWRLVRDHDGFVSDQLSHMRFWFPESRVAFALLIDPTLVAVPQEDLIV